MTKVLDVAGAISATAATWEYSPRRPEAALGDALTTALDDICGVKAIEAGRRKFRVPDWQPAPRGIDLYVPDETGLPWLLFELKVGAIHEVLYDLYKLSAQLQWPHAAAGYSVVAATKQSWAKQGDCVGFFNGAIDEPLVFDCYDVFTRYEAAWRDLRAWRAAGKRKSSGCPIRIPRRLQTTLIASAPATREPDYEIRAIRVRGEGDCVEFQGDWPLGYEPSVPIGPDPFSLP